MYKNPMFLVTSDDPINAENYIISPQSGSNDVFFVGTIKKAVEGDITRKDSTGKHFSYSK